ncbi:MAG: S8 family serine peptidase [Oligoflexia bacterium]|nr:S8 family serine peptidase [Oligoflexia bacterium]
MNKLIISAVAMVAMASQSAQGSQYIVKFKSSIKNKNVSALNALSGGVQSLIPQLNMAVVEATENDTKRIKNNLASDVEYVALNGKRFLFQQDNRVMPQADTDELWGLQAINVKGAWNITTGSRDIVLAVSDTGAWLQHFDLENNLWKNKGEIGKDANGKDKTKNKIDDDGNGYIDDVYGFNFETNSSTPAENHYHGTHVSGTVGAVGDNNNGIAGVNKLVSLMTVKFIGADGWGSDEGAVRTIIYAAENGARVLNCSWGDTAPSQPIEDAVKFAMDRGMLVVAAAGNDGTDNDKSPHYPSNIALDNVISVAATQDRDHGLAFFSNYGKKTVHVAAPGHNILSTWNPMHSLLRRVWYYEISGTSMAAPHVTGTLGLMYAANPKLHWRDAKNILLSTVTKVPKHEGKIISGGVINAAAAVQAAKALATP